MPDQLALALADATRRPQTAPGNVEVLSLDHLPDPWRQPRVRRSDPETSSEAVQRHDAE